MFRVGQAGKGNRPRRLPFAAVVVKSSVSKGDYYPLFPVSLPVSAEFVGLALADRHIPAARLPGEARSSPRFGNTRVR